PFAKVTPHDPHHNRGRHALHNYFLLKSLHLTRPGGLVMALTSRYTLDAHNPAARREMAGLADLIGAIRLPEGAFARSSGTDVVVDLLVLRRRLPGAEPTGPSWEHAVTTSTTSTDDRPGGEVEVNEYLVAHPDRVLGDLVTTRGMYRDDELSVAPTGNLDEQLPAALDRLVADATATGLRYVARSPTEAHRTRALPQATGDFDLTHAQDGSFVVTAKGEVAVVRGGVPVAYEPRFAKDGPELVRLVGLRDAAR